MKWKYKEEDCSKNDLEYIENNFNIKLPEIYKDLVLKNNGAYPEFNNYLFKGEEKVVQALITCNRNIENNVIEITNNINIRGVVAFMSDPFGNYICFQFTLDNNYSIVLWEHEDSSIIVISESFEAFLNLLY